MAARISIRKTARFDAEVVYRSTTLKVVDSQKMYYVTSKKSTDVR